MISVLIPVLLTISCAVTGEPLPTEERSITAPHRNSRYQLIYDSPNPLTSWSDIKSLQEKRFEDQNGQITVNPTRSRFDLVEENGFESKSDQTTDRSKTRGHRQGKIIEAEKTAMVIYQTENKIRTTLGGPRRKNWASDFADQLTALKNPEEPISATRYYNSKSKPSEVFLI